jgi:hypothetical protein
MPLSWFAVESEFLLSISAFYHCEIPMFVSNSTSTLTIRGNDGMDDNLSCGHNH